MVGSNDDGLQEGQSPRPEPLLQPPETAWLLPVDQREVRVRRDRYALHDPAYEPRRTVGHRWHQRATLSVMAYHQMDKKVALKWAAPVGPL